MVTVCESLGWATAGEFSGVALLLVYMLFDVGSLHLHISIYPAFEASVLQYLG